METSPKKVNRNNENRDIVKSLRLLHDKMTKRSRVCERVEEDNFTLKAENIRLKEENEKLKY